MSVSVSESVAQRPSITVPGNVGLKMLRTYTGMLASMHGSIALGWRTCAPKYASSIASSYLSDAIGKASGTRRGSAVYTPSVFFHIVTRLAAMSLAKMVAEKSEPERLSVVGAPCSVTATKPVTTRIGDASA